MVIREHLCLLTLLASTASAFVPQLARRSIITTQTRRRAATNANADELLQQRADPTLAKDERRTIDALLVDHAWDRAVNSSSPSAAATLFDRRDALDAAKPPRRLAAAAAVASARLGDVDACDAYLRRALANKPAQSLGTKARSSLVQALCMTPCRAPKALEIALSLLDEGSANGWLSAGARRALGLQLIQAARRFQANAAAGDDEACLLGRAVAAPLAPTGSDEGCDLLARDLHGDVVTPATALAWAELVADGAPRGRSTRDALCAVAAIAYHVERDERRALDAVRGALRRGAGSRGSSVEESAPAVLRGVLREALGRGDSDAAEKIIGELERRGEAGGQAAALDVLLDACAEAGDVNGALDALRKRDAVAPADAFGRQKAGASALKAATRALAARGPRVMNAALEVRETAEGSHPSLNAARAASDLVLTLIHTSDGKQAADVALRAASSYTEEVAHDAFLTTCLEACEAVAAAATARLGDEGAFVANNPDVALRQAAVDCVVAIAAAAPARPAPTDAALYALASARGWREAAHVAQRLGDDEHASYGALRAAALSARPDAACEILTEAEARGAVAPRSLLAVAVSFAEAGEISSALGAWEEIAGDVDATARAALCSALVNGGETGVRAAAKVLQGSAGSWKRTDADRDAAHEATRVRAALSARVGTARNWAEGATDQDASTKLAAGGARVVVSETTYARLTAALLRRRVAVDARAAIVTLTRHGILPSSDVRDYFDGSDRTSKLYRTLFAEDAPDEVEEWYDNLPNRRAAQLDPQRERLVARRLVATTRLAGEKPHS